ncbi:MAG: leucine-rich repeat protein [Clostridia bacterium]|nr:leucine-rich repeat protein [Clostridia bacterium]
MKKRTWITLTLLSLLLALSCMLCACDNGTADGETTTKKDDGTTAPDDGTGGDDDTTDGSDTTDAAEDGTSNGTGSSTSENDTPDGECKNHIFGEWVITQEATCTQNGKKARTCTICSKEEILSFSVEHSYDLYWTCTECGDTLTISQGLTYKLQSDDTYAVTGIGTCTDTNIIIAGIYNEKPVTAIEKIYGSSITSVLIPNSITSIRKEAFRQLDELTSITIPDSVKMIGEEAFYSCDKLSNIAIGSNVTRIESEAFGGCWKLTDITVVQNNPNYTSIDGNLYNKDKTTIIQYAIGKTDTSFAIPDTVTKINDNAFYDSNNLTTIDIPDSVTAIGTDAFSSCEKLRQIENGVSYIDNWAIDCNDTDITEISLRDNTVGIGSFAFSYCKNLTAITMPEGLLHINMYAFSNCERLTHLSLPSSVINIAERAFDNCNNLVYTIQEEICYLGNTTNPYLIAIKPESQTIITANFHPWCRLIYSHSFYQCEDLKTVTLGDKIVKIGTRAFSYCEKLADVELSQNSNLTTIENEAFYVCPSLTNMELPNSVISIGDSAFYGCENLISLTTFPKNLTSIGKKAFFECHGLTNITLLSNVTDIGSEAFARCTSLTNISVDINNPKYKSINGNLYTKDEKILIQYALGKSDTFFVIPTSVSTIENSAFCWCENLIHIEITKDSNLTTIGNSAFQGCEKLINVEIPDSVTCIGEDAFCFSENLMTIELPNGITSIESCTFEMCSNLTNIIIPVSVSNIQSEAFSGCGNLTSVYYKGVENDWNRMSISTYNFPLTSATIYYYSETEPTDDGNYWRYVDGVPTAWE